LRLCGKRRRLRRFAAFCFYVADNEELMMLRSLREKIEPSHTALLVVDVQNDYCSPDSPMGRNGRDLSAAQAIIPNLQRLLQSARSAGTMVVFVRMVKTDATESDVQREQRLRSRHVADTEEFICRKDSWGGGFYEVTPRPGELVVDKHRYSGFINTDLDLILRSNGIRTIVVAGVATNVCVESTARDGFMHDYYVVVPSDGSAAYKPERHAAALENIVNSFGIVATVDEIAAVWSGAPVAIETH
jgi:ureidoacrylate peracid hydrolase